MNDKRFFLELLDVSTGCAYDHHDLHVKTRMKLQLMATFMENTDKGDNLRSDT